MDALGSGDRQQLDDALRRLRDAVIAMDLGASGEATNVLASIASAERDLWRLRSDLLGWRRPSWAPPASLVADWFSKEDAAYDDLPDASTV